MTVELTDWLKTGYRHLKVCAEIPDWFLPERTVELIVDELGYGELMQLAVPLAWDGDIETCLPRPPAPRTIPAEAWANAIKSWSRLSQMGPLVQSFYEANGRIEAKLHEGEFRGELAVACRGLAVLFIAPFIPQGERLVSRLAVILGASPDEPVASLIDRYVEGVIGGDEGMLEKINSSHTPQTIRM